MTTDTKERPVLKAIASIMAEVGAIEKKGRNDFHRYDYATASDIAHALQKRMANAGLIIVPNQRKMELMADGAVLAIEFEFMVEHVSGDKLDERPAFTGMASAKNSKGGFDDKAANKCLTAATKYFALNLFRIPTGDYHDADANEDAPQQRPQARQKPKQQAETPFDDADTDRRMADQLRAMITATRSIEDLDAVKKAPDFAATWRSLPDAMQKEIAGLGAEHREYLAAMAAQQDRQVA